MKVFILITILANIVLSSPVQEKAIISELCSFEKPLVPAAAVSVSFARLTEAGGRSTVKCDCDVTNSAPWGMPGVEILCIDMKLHNDYFSAEHLPAGTIVLDMSYNEFEVVPHFVGEQLTKLDLSNNEVATLSDNNFAGVKRLQKLDLSFNKIEIVGANAFNELGDLRELILIDNRISVLSKNLFSPLISLEVLMLSENNLNNSFNMKDVDLFLTYGVTPRLRILEVEHCNLTNIDISRGAGLDEIKMGYNDFETVPAIPRGVKELDLSGNPVSVLTPKFLPHLVNLETLFMEDMPNLHLIDEYSLYGLPNLRHLNLQGSKKLETFHVHAFGRNVINNETDTQLEKLNLRGANLKTLNSSLSFAFENLKELELGGNPLRCDCEIRWLKSLEIETNAECSKPFHLRKTKLSDVGENKLQCRRWKSWVYMVFNVVLILLLIVLCGIAVYLIYLGIRPKNRQLRKVGGSSPYARVTIEPNRAEPY